jgi:hypothetical protein
MSVLDRTNDRIIISYLVAGNIRGREAVRADETVVLVGSAPGDTLRDTAADHGAGETLVLGAINFDADDTAVCVSRSGERAQEGGGLEERHVVCFVG